MQEQEQRDYVTKGKQKGQMAPLDKQKKSGFSQYSFFPQLYLNTLLNKIRTPTPVQRKTIPLIMEGKDVVACYKTGSGKTLAYILPILNKLQSHSQIVGARALILIPTRDLADQITKVLKSYLHKIDLRYSLILGGHDYEGQFESLSINPDLIIATPGRLMQLLTETDLQLSRVQTIVFDQADQLLGEGKFQKEVKQIISKCNVSAQRLMFSATITEDIRMFANAGMREYSFLNQEITLPETMKLDFWVLRSQEKVCALMYCLQKIIKRQKVIVFAATRFHVDFLLSVIQEMKGIVCFGVYGKMDMEQRTYNLDNFRNKKGKAVLIVTDVAARGLDIPSVKYVVHYDYPSNHQIFVHRSGRTARGEETGNTIAFISHTELPFMAELATFVGRKLTNSANQTLDSINYGTLPTDTLISYMNFFKELKQQNDQIEGYQTIANKAFEKFKKCRSQTSQFSVKKAKTLTMQTHYSFKEGIQQEEANFLEKIKNFNPKRSFLELQKINLDKEPENDNFLSAVEKIRKEQASRLAEQKKRERLRASNSNQWKQILTKNQIKEFQNYRENVNSQQRLPISMIEGVQIELNSNNKVKKSQKKDFRNPDQYISGQKDPKIKSQFDNLPKIKLNEMQDVMMEDENPVKNRKKRVWDKSKKNYIWQKDQEDKYSKEEKGKKAYDQWKKKSKLHIPRAGDVEDQDRTDRAKESWTKRRKSRHGWRQAQQTGDKPSGERGRGRGNLNLKNNKTKAFQKKYKSKLIQKASKGSSGKGGASRGGGTSRGRGSSRGRGGSKMGGKGRR